METKKNYVTPSEEVVKVETTKMLCHSGGDEGDLSRESSTFEE